MRPTTLIWIARVIMASSLLAGSSAQAWEAEREDEIVEAVFRYQATQCAGPSHQPRPAYFIGIKDPASEGWRDPSAALLQRFAGHAPPVKPFSAWQPAFDEAVRRYGLHEATIHHRPGAMMLIQGITPTGGGATVQGSRECGYDDTEIGTYLVTPEGDHWIVTYTRESIS
jgi:hypothetical protein